MISIINLSFFKTTEKMNNDMPTNEMRRNNVA